MGATVYLSIDLLKVLTKHKLVKALIGSVLVRLVLILTSVAGGHGWVRVQPQHLTLAMLLSCSL